MSERKLNKEVFAISVDPLASGRAFATAKTDSDYPDQKFYLIYGAQDDASAFTITSKNIKGVRYASISLL